MLVDIEPPKSFANVATALSGVGEDDLPSQDHAGVVLGGEVAPLVNGTREIRREQGPLSHEPQG